MAGGYVYILTNKRNGTLYIGVTNDLVRRIWEHREERVESFTKRHSLKQLAYFEAHATMPLAIQREKQMKAWKRAWKLELIEQQNPDWDDLYPQLVESAPQLSLG